MARYYPAPTGDRDRLRRIVGLAVAAWTTWQKTDEADASAQVKMVHEAAMRAYGDDMTDEAWVVATLRRLGAPAIITEILPEI